MKKLTNAEELPYLSDIIEIDKFRKGQANVIVAPCHSGKTTAAKEILVAHHALSYNGLVLIDTTAGRDSLLIREKAQRTPAEIAEILNPYTQAADARTDTYVAMTYYEFGIYAQNCPEVLDRFNIIICDEMHNLIRYLAIEEARNKKEDPDGIFAELGGTDLEYSFALKFLSEKSASSRPDAPLIVIMTATPKCLYRKFAETQTPYVVFDYTGKVRCDKTSNIIHYSNFSTLIQQIDTRTIVYVPTIKLMQQFSAIADNGSRKIMCLWSLHNKEHPMSDNQITVRSEILDSRRIPSDIDILFINAAYETSINIDNEDFNTMVIHTGNTDVQIQARGRLRHDIQNLYLYDASHNHIAEFFPKEFFNIPLSASDREIIAQRMALVNSKGRPLKWPSIAAALKKDGLRIESFRNKNKHFCTVYPRSLSS